MFGTSTKSLSSFSIDSAQRFSTNARSVGWSVGIVACACGGCRDLECAHARARVAEFELLFFSPAMLPSPYPAQGDREFGVRLLLRLLTSVSQTLASMAGEKKRSHGILIAKRL